VQSKGNFSGSYLSCISQRHCCHQFIEFCLSRCCVSWVGLFIVRVGFLCCHKL